MLPVDLPGTVRDALLAPLVDHHCHGVRRDDLSRAQFELLSGEGGSPAPPGTTHFDTPFGAAVRRWCAPLLDLEPHAPPAVYLARRTELGAGEVNRRLLTGAGVVAFLVDATPDTHPDTHPDNHTATYGTAHTATYGTTHTTAQTATYGTTHTDGRLAPFGGAHADGHIAPFGGAHADGHIAPHGPAHATASGAGHADLFGDAHAAIRAARHADPDADHADPHAAPRTDPRADSRTDPRADPRADSRAGFAADLDVLTAAEMGRHGGAAADELVRIEHIEQDVAATAELAVDYLDNLADELAARAARAVGLKTVIGARCGLDFDPARPSRGAVIAAANRRLSDPKGVLTDHVLLRYLLWSAIDVARERGLPVQFHTGFGGRTGEPHRADPARLSAFAAALQPLGVPVILLHCYPYHRQAAHLAGVFPHVYVDVGLAPPHGTAAAARVMDELLELAPFHKQLFSSGCRGLAETGYLGALTYRRALAAALGARIEAGEWSASDAARVAHMIGSGNARRIYRL
ncbi:hypothetical protein GCM10009850_069780 [Nonomuraea monospora]|uniref:Amidohydrolase n=1 Tax=Nonomuraea monospora TaxID=568818 RepID=A0ABN3CQD5_9ACTN